MGASESVIINQDDVKMAFNAGEITVNEKCRYTLCYPNIEPFGSHNANANGNGKNNYKDRDKGIILLLLVLILFLFISLLVIKRT
jgi:hypothetical protein